MSDNDENSTINKMINTSNQTIKTVIQLTPVFIFLSCVLLWLHLKEINRLDLFMSSMTNISSVIPIILSFFLYILTLLKPSIPLLIIPFLFRKTHKTAIDITVKLSLAIMMSLLTFAISIPSFAYLFYKLGLQAHYYMATLLAFNIATTAVIMYFVLRSERIENKIIIVVMVCIAMKFSFNALFPLLNQLRETTPDAFFSITLTLSIYIFCIFTPATVYLYSSIKNDRPNLRLLTLSLMFLIVPMSFIKEINSYTIEKTMISIGIADWCVNTYRINSSKYSKEIFPNEYWDTKMKTTDNHFYISATAPFHLGDKILLCPEYLSANYIKTLMINYNITKKDRGISKRLVRNQFQSCFIFNSADVDKSNTAFSNIVEVSQLPEQDKCI
ncbi:TPA: hypothetical protein I8Y13_003003 [Raoultella planticola]|nr:hypothetical protein [Raoultella planticola]HAT1676011.1 hypothetical protein [Raoultella planticola]